MSEPADVPPEILERLRGMCLGFPETHEEAAWIGTRWRIRGKTFAHVYTRPDETGKPLCRMTFRSPLDEVAGLTGSGHPFFKPDWSPEVVGMVLDDDTDWVEVAELLTESYRVRAPKKLAAQAEVPEGERGGREEGWR